MEAGCDQLRRQYKELLTAGCAGISVKELRDIARNCGAPQRGNKAELCQAVLDKLAQIEGRRPVAQLTHDPSAVISPPRKYTFKAKAAKTCDDIIGEYADIILAGDMRKIKIAELIDIASYCRIPYQQVNKATLFQRVQDYLKDPSSVQLMSRKQQHTVTAHTTPPAAAAAAPLPVRSAPRPIPPPKPASLRPTATLNVQGQEVSLTREEVEDLLKQFKRQ